MAHRLRTPLPKIGIRPTIDGRYGGVRESLEGQVMAMAKTTSDLLSNLRHASGEPVECVIADRAIGGVAEAADCAEKFRREGVGVSITVTPCWCYGSETMDMDPQIPKAIWGFNGTERPGAVYLAATLAAHAQKGLPCFGIYGKDVQDAGDTSIPGDVKEKLLRFARAGLAAATMKGTSYLSVGGTSMGIGGSIVDPELFERWFGMRAEAVDMSEVLGRIQKGLYDQAEYDRALAWTRANCKEGKDWNPEPKQRTRNQKDADWEMSVKMALIVRDLMVGNPNLDGYPEQALGHNALVGGFQGQRQWTDHFPNGDFLEAILTSSFDWNGIRQPYMVATENDALNGMSMLFGHLLTGSAQLFADVRTYWSPAAINRVTGRAEDGVLHLINSGPAALDWTGQMTNDQNQPTLKPSWEISEAEVQACLDATLWCPSMLEYFPGGGWSTDFTTRGRMPVTMCRLNLVRGLGPVMQIVEGVTVNLSSEVHQKLDERTNPTWPTTWFLPRTDPHSDGPFKDAYSVMNAWGANHGAIAYGHIGADLITLCSILRIPVDMHNVPADRIFRPAVWDRFGAMDAKGADFRACANYGPLYG
ncbi:MAG: L-fucose isomerase [Fimbriimonadaceae bacterium]|nr:L-fucose isomerase [Fimbriimonadaceae bacterium]